MATLEQLQVQEEELWAQLQTLSAAHDRAQADWHEVHMKVTKLREEQRINELVEQRLKGAAHGQG